MNIWIINGPNLNLLGTREIEIYGTNSLEDLESLTRSYALKHHLSLTFLQSNHEGQMIDWLHEAHHLNVSGIILNAGALSHYSYAIYDAIVSIKPFVVEVHLTDLMKRKEPFRHISILTAVCKKTFSGKGFDSYLEALAYIKEGGLS